MRETVLAEITALEAQAVANLFLSDHLPDRFFASTPQREQTVGAWRVPVRLCYPVIGSVGEVGEILVDVHTEQIISHTPVEEMSGRAQRLYEANRDAIRAAFVSARDT